MKHKYQLMASTLRMCTTISPPAVAAMDSCFALIGDHQHDIAMGSMSCSTCASVHNLVDGEISLFELRSL